MVDFDTNVLVLREAGITVYSASVDDAETTKALKDGMRIGYVNMLHSVDAHAVAEATGAMIQEGDRVFLHATGFMLDPEGNVSAAVYSNGPIGRFSASDILKKMAFEKLMIERADKS